MIRLLYVTLPGYRLTLWCGPAADGRPLRYGKTGTPPRSSEDQS